MLIMCLFSLSAILASVLITIYILQHLHWEKEPTLIVPDWQSRAIKHGTICSEQSNIWGSETTQRRGSACSVRAGEENGGTGVSLLFNKKFPPFPLVSVPASPEISPCYPYAPNEAISEPADAAARSLK